MHTITWSEFLILLVCLVAAMTASRILPLMLLKGRKICLLYTSPSPRDRG